MTPACAAAAATDAAPAAQAGAAPLTRVALAHVERRIALSLRFGAPIRVIRIDRWRCVAVFGPGAVFGRLRWHANACGAARWQFMVMQACTPLDFAQRIPGVLPGARLLLHAEGESTVRAVLPLVDAIEALGIAPADVEPAYWRSLGRRLAARLPLPVYTRARHAAWRAGRAPR